MISFSRFPLREAWCFGWQRVDVDEPWLNRSVGKELENQKTQIRKLDRRNWGIGWQDKGTKTKVGFGD